MSAPLWRTRLGLAGAGVALAAYPVLRPYGPETGRAGATTFASTSWLVAHVLAMAGFVLLAVGVRGVGDLSARRPGARRWGHRLGVTAWAAVALLLPYYGAEGYGLHELGRYAVATGDPGVLAVADRFRYAPFEITSSSLGLLALAAVGVGLAHGLRHAGPLGRTGGLLAGAALSTYLPQFAAGPQIRIAHGVVLGVGLLLVATTRPTAPSSARSHTRTAPERRPAVSSATG